MRDTLVRETRRMTMNMGYRYRCRNSRCGCEIEVTKTIQGSGEKPKMLLWCGDEEAVHEAHPQRTGRSVRRLFSKSRESRNDSNALIALRCAYEKTHA